MSGTKGSGNTENPNTLASIAAAIWAFANRTLTSAANITNDNLPVSNANITSILQDTNTTLPGEHTVIEQEIYETEHHLHNVERWCGIKNPQTATVWCESVSTAGAVLPYVAISGNADYGADANDEAQVFGTDDLPAIAGSTKFDLHRIEVINWDSNTLWILRIIWGSGTMADAISDGQYTEVPFLPQVLVGNNSASVPLPIIMRRTSVGDKLWVQAKNDTDNAEIEFIVGEHEYIR